MACLPEHVGELVPATAARLRDANVGDTARLDAELLVGHVVGLDRVGLRTHDDREVGADEAAMIEALVTRRIAGEPIAYLLGTSWFYGREFDVDARVLVPRPETELLVELALAHLDARSDEDATPAYVADICTGSGCVGISIAAELPAAHVTCADLSTDAIAVARINAARHAPDVVLATGDLLEPLADTPPLAVITANPPYVEGADAAGLQASVRDHEPHVALFVPDGGARAIYGRIAVQAAQLLEPGGLLAVEHGMGQRALVMQAFETAGLERIAGHDDLAGIDRVVVGYRSPEGSA